MKVKLPGVAVCRQQTIATLFPPEAFVVKRLIFNALFIGLLYFIANAFFAKSTKFQQLVFGIPAAFMRQKIT
jgi:hypothetical protein